MKTKILLFGMLLFLLTFNSCDTKDDAGNSSTLSADEANVNAKIDEITDDVSKIVEDQYNVQENSGDAPQSILPACATLTTVVSGNTWTRTIDFGTTGCAMPNGNILTGIIIVSGSTDFNQPSHTITYSFIDFYHNAKLIQGNKTIVRSLQSTTANQAIHPVANMTIDMSVTYPNGNVYTRVGTRVREMVEGFDTPLVWIDNVFVITGNWTTTLPNAAVQTSTITTPLTVRMNCNYIVSGAITIVRNNVTAVLDYGNGVCDNVATVTINGVTNTITLGN
ncbi:hypothetical protein [Flavobacterium sp.]|uniref:hypothetical protein n=1 Tax=Flavobacterium sp. TaxID=239 RepID=UPI002B4AC710|nr:hypothetical protein [Flavobacterium sp.]HLF52158.1 hypothetical protein [Flavobacterium sp.]